MTDALNQTSNSEETRSIRVVTILSGRLLSILASMIFIFGLILKDKSPPRTRRNCRQITKMMKDKKLQFVWPKDGPRGKSGHRGFLGQLNNILTDRGPDIYIQRGGSRKEIKPDIWGNWAGYHDRSIHLKEDREHVSRGLRRYDPQSRRYVHWAKPHDWFGNYVDPNSKMPIYPRFTRQEHRNMAQTIASGNQVDPNTMGKHWHHAGPKRFNLEHDFFWQNAHRVNENIRQGYSPRDKRLNGNLRMHQQWPDDVDRWMYQEGL